MSCPHCALQGLSAQMHIRLILIMKPDDHARGAIAWQPSGWLGVEVRHFAALQALAEEGSFGRAAVRLGYTQSAVSQQIATLERHVGERLVERPGGPRPISLTEAGTLMLRHAESIVARLQAAQADLQALRAGEAGTLRVGTVPVVPGRASCPRSCAGSLRSGRRSRSGSRSSKTTRSRAPVESGQVDVGFVLLPVGEAPLETVELLRGCLRLDRRGGLAPSHPSRPSLRRISEEALVGFRRGGAPPSSIEAAFAAEGIEPHFAVPLERQPDGAGTRGSGNRRRDPCRGSPSTRGRPSHPRRRASATSHRTPHRRDRAATATATSSPSARAFVETALGSALETRRLSSTRR